jgi:uncharacterized protein involved in exopolysaccharide biosynthesis
MPYKLRNYRIFADEYQQAGAPRRIPKRLKVFLAVFLPLLLAAQIYIFLQPAIYHSEASVLTMAATAVDQASPDPDLQHVNIQQQLLLGDAVLQITLETLQKQTVSLNLSIADLRAMFAITAITDTNLLKLSAEGSEPLLLRNAVNAWISAYQQTSANYMAQNSDKSRSTIKGELQRIAQQISDKSREIDLFRKQHDILSLDSTDNQAHSRLQGLNESLNNALEQEVNARAKMDAIHAAVKQGKPVIAESDSRGLAVLIEQAEKLRAKLAELRSKFTEEYILFNPNFRNIPEQLARLDAQIAEEKQAGTNVAAVIAEENYAAAHQAVIEMQLQLREHKQAVFDYTNQFAKHQALQQELEALENLQQETKQRLVDIDVKQRENIPQVELVDAASLPAAPISPDYRQESALAFPACLLLGLFAVWLSDYLQRENQPPGAENFPIAYLNPIITQALSEFSAPQSLSSEQIRSLEKAPVPRELSHAEISDLFIAADPQTQIIIALLLNGLSSAEILSLHSDSFELAEHCMTIPLSKRKLRLTACTYALIERGRWTPHLSSQEEIDALLGCAAIDAGLFMPEQIRAELISFSYCLFLIRQGIKLSDLPKIIGPVKAERLLQLGKFSPEAASLTLEQINMDYLK